MHRRGPHSVFSTAPSAEHAGMRDCIESQAVLMEMKAQEANRAALRVQKEQTSQHLEMQAKILRERLSSLAVNASLERGHLQSQLSNIEHRLRGIAVHRMPNERDIDQWGGEEEQVARFCFAIGELLRTRPTRRAPIRELQADERVQQRWQNLQRSRIIQRSMTLKQLLKDRCKMFEFFVDQSYCEMVCFAGEREVATLQGSALSPIMGYSGAYPTGLPGQLQLPGRGPLPPGPLPPGQYPPLPMAGMLALPAPQAPGMRSFPSSAGPVSVPLTAEQLFRVEMELTKNGGTERCRKICLHLNLQEAQLGLHFRLFEDAGKTLVTYKDPELTGLEELIAELSPRRSDIATAMQHCLEHATNHAEALARLLARSLQVPDVQSEERIARLFLLSDVLYNSKSHARGATRYRAVLEQLLPDVCEWLGREWMRSPEFRGESSDRLRASSVVSRVLNSWRSWDVFPDVYIGGLEALLLGPAPEEAPDKDDKVLTQRLVRWCSETNPLELPTAARRRGLGGPTLSVEQSRERLCMYEIYWHRSAIERAAQEAEWAQALRKRQAAAEALAAQARAAKRAHAKAAPWAVADDPSRPAPDPELDGDPMSDGEWACTMPD